MLKSEIDCRAKFWRVAQMSLISWLIVFTVQKELVTPGVCVQELSPALGELRRETASP